MSLSMYIEQNFNIFEKWKIEPIFGGWKFHISLFLKLAEVTLETWEFFQNQIKMYSEGISLSINAKQFSFCCLRKLQ